MTDWRAPWGWAGKPIEARLISLLRVSPIIVSHMTKTHASVSFLDLTGNVRSHHLLFLLLFYPFAVPEWIQGLMHWFITVTPSSQANLKLFTSKLIVRFWWPLVQKNADMHVCEMPSMSRTDSTVVWRWRSDRDFNCFNLCCFLVKPLLFFFL